MADCPSRDGNALGPFGFALGGVCLGKNKEEGKFALPYVQKLLHHTVSQSKLCMFQHETCYQHAQGKF